MPRTGTSQRYDRVDTAAQDPQHRPADPLRAPTRDVRRISDGYRRDPEAIATVKDDIAYELLILARRLVEGGRS